MVKKKGGWHLRAYKANNFESLPPPGTYMCYLLPCHPSRIIQLTCQYGMIIRTLYSPFREACLWSCIHIVTRTRFLNMQSLI